MPTLKKIIFFHEAEKAYSVQLDTFIFILVLIFIWLLSKCLENMTVCYFNKTYALLILFYRLKSEKLHSPCPWVHTRSTDDYLWLWPTFLATEQTT